MKKVSCFAWSVSALIPALLLLFGCNGKLPAPSGLFPGTVILGRPTDTSVTASILSPDHSGHVFIAYGTTSGKYTGQTKTFFLQAGAPLEVAVNKLAPDTQHYYRVYFCETFGASFTAIDESSFHTQRKPGSSFIFTVQADPHVNDTGFAADIYTTTLNNVRADAPDFHIDLGDTFLTEKSATTRSDVTTSFTNHRPFFCLTGVPLFLVNGNHEGELGWLRDGSADNLAVWSCLDRRTYYPTPVPGDFYSGSSTVEPFTGIRDAYYSFTWGDALFVMLDPFWYTADKPAPSQLDNNWNWTLGREQYDWLRQTLESSSSRYKFVLIHHLVAGIDTQARGGIEAAPFYEWGGKSQGGADDFSGRRPGWGQPVQQMLKDNNVTAVFHGHDHVFAKQELDGIGYQECPRPSYKQAAAVADATAAGYVSGEILPSPGYLRVRVSSAQVQVEYVRTLLPKDETNGHVNGEVAFVYTIDAK